MSTTVPGTAVYNSCGRAFGIMSRGGGHLPVPVSSS